MVKSRRRVLIPAWIGERSVVLDVFVVPGRVPLLLSKGVIKTLRGSLDFEDDQLHFKAIGVTVPLQAVGPGGHYVMDVCTPPSGRAFEGSLTRM